MTPSAPQSPLHDETDLVERWVGRVLFWGGLVSVALLIVGLALYAATGGYRIHASELEQLRHRSQARPLHVVVSLRELIGGVLRRPIDPVKVMTVGVVILLVVPVIGVAVAIPAFLIVGDRRYALIAAAVFGMLTLSFLLAGGIG
jgi:uncharacterized membrane protein